MAKPRQTKTKATRPRSAGNRAGNRGLPKVRAKGGGRRASEEVYEGPGASPLSVVRRATEGKTQALNR